MCYMQGCSNVTDVALEVGTVVPYVLIVGSVEDARQAFLVVDKHIVMMIDLKFIPFVLMSAFFVYNIHYPSGCSNFYSFMEAFTLGFSLENASPTVKHFVASLDCDF